jgi:hypothetical protein
MVIAMNERNTTDTDIAIPRARTDEEHFLALVCADEEWLRAEFNAIVAAQWPALGPPFRVEGRTGSPLVLPSTKGTNPRSFRSRTASGQDSGVTRDWTRERSPPQRRRPLELASS